MTSCRLSSLNLGQFRQQGSKGKHLEESLLKAQTLCSPSFHKAVFEETFGFLALKLLLMYHGKFYAKPPACSYQ
eukprot:4119153-Amphidinium_carterae.1